MSENRLINDLLLLLFQSIENEEVIVSNFKVKREQQFKFKFIVTHPSNHILIDDS